MARSSEPSSVLEVLLTETGLRLKAGPASYERGERYATTQRVKKLKAAGSELSATVTGTSQYRVRIWVEEGDLKFFLHMSRGRDRGILQALRGRRARLVERGESDRRCDRVVKT